MVLPSPETPLAANEVQPLIADLNEALGMTSICGLGRSLPMPLRTLTAYFPDDLALHLTTAEKAQ